MNVLAFLDFAAPAVHPYRYARNGDYANNTQAEGSGITTIRFKRLSLAAFETGALSHSAEQTYIGGAQLGKTMAATSLMYGRLRW